MTERRQHNACYQREAQSPNHILPRLSGCCFVRRVSGRGILIRLGLFRVGGALESCKDAQTVSLRMPDMRSSSASSTRATETPKKVKHPSLAGPTHPRWLERRQTSRRVATPTRGCPAQSRSTAGHQTQTSGLSWIFDGLEGPLPARQWRLAFGVAGPLAGRPTDWLSARNGRSLRHSASCWAVQPI